MASQLPLVIASGQFKQLQSGDTLADAALPNVVTAGTVGSGTQVPVVTYDAKGRITSTTTAAISAGVDAPFAFFLS